MFFAQKKLFFFCSVELKFFSGCGVEYALEAASLHPALALGIDNRKGTLNYGNDADFIMLTDGLDVLSTWIAGECVFKK